MTYPHDHDDLQLDAWLETQSGATPTSLNGTADFPPEALVTVARQYHTALHAAERRAVPNIPARQIWEDVMSNTATIGTIAIPGTAGNGTMPPSNRKPLPVPDDSWSKPGHWLVPTLLFAAVLIGILAVYANFLDPNNSSEPTSAPGVAFSSPEATASINELLPDPRNGCAATSAGQATPAMYSSSSPTNLPMPVENYIPFSRDVPDADQHTIADRYLRVQSNCPATTDDPLISDDFSWMPGPGITPATADKIESARQISAALPSQDYMDYYIIQPAAGVSSFVGQYLLLPEDVMRLPDGRLGASLRQVIQSDNPDADISSMTQGHEMAPSVFVVFEQVDGLWLYDEMFLLCIGDCDYYWSVVAGEIPAATPTATLTSDDAFWLEPLTASECVVVPISEVDLSERIQNPSDSVQRSYIPLSFADPALAEQVAAADRAWNSCNVFGSINQRAAIQTDTLTSQGPEDPFANPGFDDTIEDWAEDVLNRFDTRREMGETISTGDWTDFIRPSDVIFDVDGNLRVDMLATLPWPERAVALTDGRIAMPQVEFMSAETYATYVEAAEAGFVRSDITIHILALDLDTNTWVVDEVISACAIDCDANRLALSESLETTIATVKGPATSKATPPATPSMTPSEVLPAPTADTTCVNGTIIQPAEITPPPVAGEDCRGDDPTDGGDLVRIEPRPHRTASRNSDAARLTPHRDLPTLRLVRNVRLSEYAASHNRRVPAFPPPRGCHFGTLALTPNLC